NEAFLASEELGKGAVTIVVPSLSIAAVPPVAVVERRVESQGLSEIAKAYVEYLYSPVGQRLAAKHFYRPVSPEFADPADLARFSSLELFQLEELFGSWKEAQKKHFDDGGVFDEIYLKEERG